MVAMPGHMEPLSETREQPMETQEQHMVMRVPLMETPGQRMGMQVQLTEMPVQHMARLVVILTSERPDQSSLICCIEK